MILCLYKEKPIINNPKNPILMEEISKGSAKVSMEVDFKDFKNNFFEFVRVNLGINLLVPNFYFKVKDFFSQSKGGSLIISCGDKNKLFSLISLLEKTSIYEKRLEMENCNLKVSQLEVFETPEKVNLLKKFFCKLESLLPNSFKIENPATVIAGEISDDGFVTISLSFFETYMVDKFVSVVPSGWNYEISGLKKISISLELVEIKEFISGNHAIFNERNDDNRLSFAIKRNTFFDCEDYKPGDEKGLRFIGTDLSFLDSLHESEDIIRKPIAIIKTEKIAIPIKIDVDIGKQKILNKVKITETKKEQKQEQTKIEVMKNGASTKKSVELIELVNKRKSFANGVISGLQTKYAQLDSRIKIETGRFTHTAEGFLVSVPTVFNQQVTGYFNENKISYRDNKDGNFWIIYPDKYASSKTLNKDDGKALIRLAEKERDAAIRILANNNFFHKKGGRAKKNPGVFSVSKTDNIIKHSMMILLISNRKLDTLNQIFKLVEGHYLNIENREMVSVVKDEKEFRVTITFAKGYFKVIGTLESASQILDGNRGGVKPNDQQDPVQSDISAENSNVHEASTLVEIAVESEHELDQQIRELEDQKNKNRHSFLVSISGIMAQSFLRVIEERGIKLFLNTQTEEGLQMFSQVSEKDIREILGESIEKLKV